MQINEQIDLRGGRPCWGAASALVADPLAPIENSGVRLGYGADTAFPNAPNCRKSFGKFRKVWRRGREIPAPPANTRKTRRYETARGVCVAPCVAVSTGLSCNWLHRVSRAVADEHSVRARSDARCRAKNPCSLSHGMRFARSKRSTWPAPGTIKSPFGSARSSVGVLAELAGVSFPSQ